MKNIENLLKRGDYWGVPREVSRKIIERDTVCIYCLEKMSYGSSIGTPKNKATIEHFSDDPDWYEEVDVGICCGSCNSSKGNKKLSDWFKKDYCLNNNINEKTVTKPVKDYLKKMGENS